MGGDVDTIKRVGLCYLKDKDSIYFEGKKLFKVDNASFKNYSRHKLDPNQLTGGWSLECEAEDDYYIYRDDKRIKK